MRLIIHVGPHKTATTTIQAILDRERAVLQVCGIFYPPGQPLANGDGYFSSHSHIPYHLRKWSWAKINIQEHPYSMVDEFISWIEQAQVASCNVILLSSEEFSRGSLEEWRTIYEHLVIAENATQVEFDRIDLLNTNRDLSNRIQSMYAELVKHGVAISFLEAKSLLEQSIRLNLDTLNSLSDELDQRFQIQFVDLVFERDAAPDDGRGLSVWFKEVLGPQVSALIDFDDLCLNERLSDPLTDELLAFNQINSPKPFSLTPPFVQRSSNDQHRLASERLDLFLRQVSLLNEAQRRISYLETEIAILKEQSTMVQSLRTELEIQSNALDAARTRVSELENSRSWRWTRWIRNISPKRHQEFSSAKLE